MLSFKKIILALSTLIFLGCLANIAAAIPVRIISRNVDLGSGIISDIRKASEKQIVDSLLDKLSLMLIASGYYNVNHTSVNDTLVLDFGHLYHIGKINLKIVDEKGEINERGISRFEGIVASQINFEKIKAELIKPYQGQGYYFASLNTEKISMVDGTINLFLKLVSGPLVRIELVRFKGLSRMNPRFVEKLSGLNKKDLLITENLEAAADRIETSGYLKNDSLPRLSANKNYDGVEIMFYLSEERSNRLELGGGYLPARAEAEGEFIGHIDFRSASLFGNGRRIELLLDRKDRASSHIEMRFGQPLFIPQHLELNLHFKQIDYDSSYYLFTADVGLTLFTGKKSSLTSRLEWTRIEPQRLSQPPSRSIAGTFGYKTNSLDYESNPAYGQSISAGFAYIRRVSRPDTLVTGVIDNETVFEVGVDNYITFLKHFVFRTNLENRIRITGRELIDFSEKFKLGGFGSLRGYRHDQFAGRRTLLGQLEIRWRQSSKFAFYVFGDLGVIYLKKESIEKMVDSETLTRIGSGFGLFIGSKTATLTLELGWGEEDGLGDGKIHMGLVTMF